MASPEQTLDLKIEALRSAVAAFAGSDLMDLKPGESAELTYAKGTSTILATANRFRGWLSGTVRFAILASPAVDENSTTEQPHAPIPEGDTVQINTGQKFSVAIDAKDAAGYPTDATVEWSIADEAVATVVHDDGDDQKGWVVSGAPGSTVLTVRVTDVEPPLEATLAVDVVPAGTATISVSTGPAVAEEDPQPEALTLSLAEDTTDANRLTVSFIVNNQGEGPVTIATDNTTLASPGDGTPVSYAYPVDGNYDVVVTDDDNATRTASETVTVPYTA